jgi:hypothetical protein
MANPTPHLQFDTTVYDWQGAQIALIAFDAFDGNPASRPALDERLLK